MNSTPQDDGCVKRDISMALSQVFKSSEGLSALRFLLTPTNHSGWCLIALNIKYFVMVKRLTFRYTFAVDALQLIHTRTEDLILAFAGVHSQAFDHGVSRLSKKLVSSLESLLTYTTNMMEYLRTEMAMEKESLCTLDVLNRCEDLCRGCNALLDMLEEARDADLDKADRSLIEDYLNCTNQIAGKMRDLSQTFVAARNSQAYGQVTTA
jgi:hypothetical protein